MRKIALAEPRTHRFREVPVCAGTIVKGTIADKHGMSLPAGPGAIKANGNCKTDPKGYHPHQPSFEACVALIKSEKCTE